jgi:hypothetical protein
MGLFQKSLLNEIVHEAGMEGKTFIPASFRFKRKGNINSPCTFFKTSNNPMNVLWTLRFCPRKKQQLSVKN